MSKPITIPPTAVKLLNDLRKAGATDILMEWRADPSRAESDSWWCEVSWPWDYDEGHGKTILATIRDAIRIAKKEGHMK